MTADERAALVRRVVAEMLEVAANRGDRERVARFDEVEAAIDLIRVEVLEEAALRAEDFLGEAWEGYEIAAAIRALKEKNNG